MKTITLSAPAYRAAQGARARLETDLRFGDCRRLGPSTNCLVIVDEAEPDEYAVPGLTGRVVVSTATLRALPADERRVLLEHEAGHLRHHHHLHIQLAELGAAANPLLRPLALAVRNAAERWADEDAADRP